MGTQDLISQLQQEGQLERRGNFELDGDKARQKMQQFQLIDPHHYVLEFVQVAHILGATKIDVYIDADEVELCFDGQPLALAQLQDIYSAAFRRRVTDADRAMRHLAVGISAASAIRPARIVVEMGEHRLVCREDQEDVFEVREVEEGMPACRIYLKEQFRAAHFSEFFRNIKGDLAEKHILRNYCLYSSVPIWMDGKHINHGMRLAPHIESVIPFRSAFDYGLIGLDRHGNTSHVHMLQNGVLIQTHNMPAKLFAIEAIVSSSRLTTNLSQSAFVQDEAWQDLYAVVLKKAMYEALQFYIREALQGHDMATLPDHLLSWLRKVAIQVFAEFNYYETHGHPLPLTLVGLATMLEQIPIFEIATAMPEGHQVGPHHTTSVETIRALNMPKLYYSKKSYRRVSVKGIALVLSHDQERLSVLSDYLDQHLTEATSRVKSAYEYQVNYERWQRSPHDETLAGRYSIVAESREERVNVGWAWLITVDDDGLTKWIKDGHLFRVEKISSAQFPLQLMIAGDLNANQRFDRINRDYTYKKHVLRAFALFPQLMDAWAKVYIVNKQVVSPTVQQVVWQYIDSVFKPTLIETLLRFTDLPHGFTTSRMYENWLHAQMKDEDTIWALMDHETLSNAFKSRKGVLSIIRRFGAIAELVVGTTLDGRPQTLARIGKMLSDRRVLRYVTPDEAQALRQRVDPADVHIRHIGRASQLLVLDESTLGILRQLIIHPGWIVHVYDDVLQAVGRERFMAQPKQSLEVEGEGILHHSFQGRGLTGHLFIEHIANRSNNHMVVNWHIDKRLLCTTTHTLPFGRIVVNVECDESKANPNWDGLKDDSFTTFSAQCFLEWANNRLYQHIEKLVRGSNALEASQVMSLWDFLYLVQLKNLRWTKDGWSISQLLSTARLFKDHRGAWLNMSQVHSSLEAQGLTLYLLEQGSQMMEEKLSYPSALVLVVDDVDERAWRLQQLFNVQNVVDVTLNEQEQRAMKEARERFLRKPMQELRLQEGRRYLLVREVRRDKWRGVIGLSRDPIYRVREPMAQVEVFYEQRSLTAVNVPLEFGHATLMLEHPSLRPTLLYDDLEDQDALIEPVRQFFIEAWTALLEHVAQEPEQYRDDLKALWSYLMSCHATYLHDFFALKFLFFETPLFPTAQGHWVSYDDIRDDGPVLVTDRQWPDNVLPKKPVLLDTDGELRDVFDGLVGQVQVFDATMTAPKKSSIVVDESLLVDISDVDTQADQETLTPQRHHLVDAVQTLLLDVRGEQRVLLGDVFVERVSFLEAQQSLVEVDADRVTLGGQHPLVKRCLEHPNDQTALAFLVSSVYSAINIYEDVITDEHEVFFQSLFIHHMTQSLGV